MEEPGLDLPFVFSMANPCVQTVDGAVYVLGMDSDQANIATLYVLEKFGTAWTLVDKTRATSTGAAQRFFLISSWNPPKLRNP